MTKACPRCQTMKDAEEFYRNKRRKDGLQSHCKECHDTLTKASYDAKPGYYREAKAKTRNARIASFRATIDAAKSSPCLDCGRTYPPHIMDLDHVRGVKRFDLGTARNGRYVLGDIMAEIAKCEAVCSNCHRERTHRRRLEGTRP